MDSNGWPMDGLGYRGYTHNGEWMPDEMSGMPQRIISDRRCPVSMMEIQAHDDPRNKVYDPESADWVPERE